MAEIKLSYNYKIGIYVRESRDDNEENYETIETQKLLLIDFVKRNHFGEIFGVYEDDNVSGTVFQRHGLEHFKNDMLSGNINMLIIKDLSRLGRSNAKTLLFLDFLEENGVRVITFDGRYDSNKDNDTVGLHTWFNERYARDISEKIRASLRYKIEKGEYLGHAPYGYVKSPELKNRLLIDKDKSLTVREIYKLYIEGYGYKYIAGLMRRKGIPSPSGKSAWNAATISRILQNRAYIGDTIQGISEKISFKSKKTKRLPEAEWVVTAKTHEEIISNTVYAEAQRIRDGKRIAGKGPHKGILHLFSGIVYCGKCGNRMIARVRKGKPAGYICSKYGKYGSKACSSHYIRESVLSDAVKEELSNLFHAEELLQKVSALMDKDNMPDKNMLVNPEHLKSQLQTKRKQQETAYIDRLEGRISEVLFDKINRRLETRILNLEREIDEYLYVTEKNCSSNTTVKLAEARLLVNGLEYQTVKTLVNRITIFEPEDLADTSFRTELQELQEVREVREVREAQNMQEVQRIQKAQKVKEIQEMQKAWNVQEVQEIQSMDLEKIRSGAIVFEFNHQP